MNKDLLVNKFEAIYVASQEKLRFFFAPGRVNIIGDHIDYNGGKVLPVAISLGTTAIVRLRKDNIVQMSSTETKGKVRVDLDKEIAYDKRAGWGNYPMGVLHFLKATDMPIFGADVLFTSTLPIGAGLSSSASLEVLTGFTFMTLAGKEVDRLALAMLCQQVENDFIGVQCGIMDQFAVAMGKKGQAMFLDCSTLDFEYVPFQTGDYQLLIMDTNSPRELAGSEYNDRRLQCLEAVGVINSKRPIEYLCQATFSEIEELIEDSNVQSRARHVVWENQYVHEAKEELEDGDLKAFGECLDASHLSLANDYEVSCYELDVLVDAARSFPDCLGARMTGAGFGGCAIALVHKDAVEKIKTYVGGRYEAATKMEARFYVCDVVDGVHEV